MDRIEYVSNLMLGMDGLDSVLDVGCRDGQLQMHLSDSVEYAGADLEQNAANSVRYVGDISVVGVRRKYSCVVACDILEHLERPSEVFAKLIEWSDKATIVSLPNCFDLKSRLKFAFSGKLGGKYMFIYPEPVDRHRWLLNVEQAKAWFVEMARLHDREVNVSFMRYGDRRARSLRSRMVHVLSRILPLSLSAHTIFAVFTPVKLTNT